MLVKNHLTADLNFKGIVTSKPTCDGRVTDRGVNHTEICCKNGEVIFWTYTASFTQI